MPLPPLISPRAALASSGQPQPKWGPPHHGRSEHSASFITQSQSPYLGCADTSPLPGREPRGPQAQLGRGSPGEHPRFGMDTHTHKKAACPQTPGGTEPPPCQHPQLCWLWCHSQPQFNPARPQSTPAGAAGGAQLQSPHARMNTHSQISPVICLVNSFSLQGQRVAAKHDQSNQTIPSPDTSRVGLQNLPPNSIPAQRGRRCKAQICRHPPAPQECHLLPVSAPCGHTGPDTLLTPHQGLSPEPALWDFQSTDPQTDPPSHPGGALHTAPRVCCCVCTKQDMCVCRRQGHTALDPGLSHSLQFSEHPRPAWLQFSVHAKMGCSGVQHP